jgi:hypothetical protein
MERAGDRYEKMEEYCSTGQSLQWAVVPVEEEGRDLLFPLIRYGYANFISAYLSA